MTIGPKQVIWQSALGMCLPNTELLATAVVVRQSEAGGLHVAKRLATGSDKIFSRSDKAHLLRANKNGRPPSARLDMMVEQHDALWAQSA